MDNNHLIPIRNKMRYYDWRSEYIDLTKKYPEVNNFYMNNIFISNPNLTDWDISPLLVNELIEIYKNHCIDLETLEKIIK